MTMHEGAIRTGQRGLARKKASLIKQVKGREWVREQLNPHLEDFVAVLVADMNDRECFGHRTAMVVIPDLMDWSGIGAEAAERLLKRLNMPDEPSLLAAAELYRAVQGQDVVEVYRECKRLVDWCESGSGPAEVQALLANKTQTNGNGVKG